MGLTVVNLEWPHESHGQLAIVKFSESIIGFYEKT
ncbi:hypothetical protein WG66_011240, partial [Moniliophthora roreri]